MLVMWKIPVLLWLVKQPVKVNFMELSMEMIFLFPLFFLILDMA